MTTDEIREKFLTFFQSKGHTVVPSDSLVPKNDPTVLFTTAGMQQFKQQFLGHIEDYTRAASSQKCLRTDDLEEVGETDFHHTFFEMLGNFSFGDYFKEDAIRWAWEFLTGELRLPPEKLWVSVHTSDDEAFAIWTKTVGIPKTRILRLGDRSNFWPADAPRKGPNGPCGPCSEIFYDWGDPADFADGKSPADYEDPRFSEVWNLVFTQFERQEGGELIPLPNKNIDTGMGLERLSAVVQGQKNNFDIDIFKPIRKAIHSHVSSGENRISIKEERVIADHIRAAVIGISDGVIPSNEGRGYIMKKLIIDMTDIALRSGQTDPVIHQLVPSVCETMKGCCPEMRENAANLQNIIESVERSYIKVRNERLPELINEIQNLQQEKARGDTFAKKLGEVIFMYRDTYGLALATVRSILPAQVEDDAVRDSAWTEFDRLMTSQQEKSRAGSKMQGDVFADPTFDFQVPKTEFIGYDQAYSTSSILKIFIDDQKVDEASEGDEVKVILDKTPFYAESGGQVGDTGLIVHEQNEIEIRDTQKINGVFIHIGRIQSGTFRTDDLVRAEIDVERRLAIMRNHTATHLLQAALREILGPHVQQQGSLVNEERLRFDFTHPKPLTRAEILEIEHVVNSHICLCESITSDYMSLEEARKSGALAFFAEKYGKDVRVVSIGDFSREFCGGSHLTFTGEIGLFRITQESAIAQGIRRVEARTGSGAIEFIDRQNELLTDLGQTLKTSPGLLPGKINQIQQTVKKLEQENEKLRLQIVESRLDAIMEAAESRGSLKIIEHVFQDIDATTLKNLTDRVKSRMDKALILFASRSRERATLVVSATEKAVADGIHAGNILRDICRITGGKGGGRPQMAQGAADHPEKLDTAFQSVKAQIKETTSC